MRDPVDVIDERIRLLLNNPGMYASNLQGVETALWSLLLVRGELDGDEKAGDLLRKAYDRLKKTIGVSGAGVVCDTIGSGRPENHPQALAFYQAWADAVRSAQDESRRATTQDRDAQLASRIENLESLVELRIMADKVGIAPRVFTMGTLRALKHAHAKLAARGVKPEHLRRHIDRLEQIKRVIAFMRETVVEEGLAYVRHLRDTYAFDGGDENGARIIIDVLEEAAQQSPNEPESSLPTQPGWYWARFLKADDPNQWVPTYVHWRYDPARDHDLPDQRLETKYEQPLTDPHIVWGAPIDGPP